MAAKRRKIVGEDFDRGYGATTIPTDSGGTRAATKTGIHSFLGLNAVLATDFAGADIGAQINAAYAAVARGATIYVPVAANGGCYDFSTPIIFNTLNKAITLQGLGPGGNTNTTSQGGACLNYTPTSATTALTIDWDITTLANNGTFAVGSGLRDITLINNLCETQGGCGSSAISVKIGPTNGGLGFGSFTDVKIQGFGTGVSMPANANQTMWGSHFDNVTFKSNNIGFQCDTASEALLFKGGAFVNNGTAFKSTAAVFAKFISTHFDGNTANKVIEGTNASTNLQFVSCHWEKLGVASLVADSSHHYINEAGSVKIFGGEMIESATSGTADYWVTVGNSLVVDGLAVSSAGGVVTNMFSANAGAVTVSNDSPAVLTQAMISSLPAQFVYVYLRPSTNMASVSSPTYRVNAGSGNVHVFQGEAGTPSTWTGPAVTGRVVVEHTKYFAAYDVNVPASSGSCPTAATIGATCTTANLTIPGSITMSSLAYTVICQPTAQLSGVPVIWKVQRTATTTFKLDIAAATAAAAELQTVNCLFADQA